MARETAWMRSSAYEEPPPWWTIVHIPWVKGQEKDKVLSMRAWCMQDTLAGEFGYAVASVYYRSVGNASGTVWAFSDPNAALQFKIRWR